MLRAWQNLYVRWGTWGHALPLLTDSISICDLNDFTSYELGKLALTGNRQLLKIASSCSRGKFRPEIRGVLQKSWQTDRWECCVHLRPWGEDSASETALPVLGFAGGDGRKGCVLSSCPRFWPRCSCLFACCRPLWPLRRPGERLVLTASSRRPPFPLPRCTFS